MEDIFVTKPIFPELSDLNLHLSDVWGNQIFTNNGPKCLELENKVAAYLDCENIAVFNNGTNALIAAIQALNLTGEVIVTPFTFAATVHALHYANIKPVFVDIDPVTMTIDPKKITEAITARTSGVIGVHVYGIPCDVTAIAEIAKDYNLKIIYDGAHSFNTKSGNIPIHRFGDATVLSFHATKLFHSVEGGAVIVQDPTILEKLKLIRNFGIVSEDKVSLVGFNGKLNELQASVGLLVLDLVEEERQKRDGIAKIYDERLSRLQGIRIARDHDLSRDSYQYYCIIVEESCPLSRDEIYDGLKKLKIHARKYFYPLCSDFDCYRDNGSASRDNLPVSYKLSNQVLCLPFYGKLGDRGAIRVADAISSLIGK
jgi:dTDP-4-amino-4,6-dideoxygalactose transaminase